ncbi:aldehyde dehydrogenase family protein [Streptomyces platensis]|uniref:aldehyde dehydrogenase family protein n=1 Tax=Streptomyces platensis TaxID=58346 RepID=UPI00367CA064
MASTMVPRVGQLIGSELATPGKTRPVHDPGRLDEIVAEVAVGSPDDVDRAVRRAHEAFLTWRHVTAAERVRMLLATAEALAESAGELAPQLVREHGGVLREAHTDFALGAGFVQHTASLTEEFLRPVQFDDERSFISIEKVPRGVAAAIVPWNLPVVLAMMKLAPALATGNTLVLKPSPSAPAGLALALSRMAALLPPGVLNVVQGGSDVGAALCSHPLVRKIGFTGGTETGRQVLGAAGATIKNVTLELGGNDPAIVLDDVDIAAVLDRMLTGVYTRSGQICFAVKRVYVPRAIYRRFADAFCERVDEYTVGHGLDPDTDLGPLNNEAQYNRVLALLERTRDSSARLVRLGRKLDPGNWGNGYYVLPHVVRDAEHTDPITRQEQFAPIVPLIAYEDERQALEWANDSEYGLASSVWTSDPDRGLALARHVEAGCTFLNTHSSESLDLLMPFGGMKQSGIGREFGLHGLSSYVEDHSIRHLK